MLIDDDTSNKCIAHKKRGGHPFGAHGSIACDRSRFGNRHSNEDP